MCQRERNTSYISKGLTEVIRARELFGAGCIGTIEGSLQGMGLNMSFQMLQSLEPFRTSNLGASMVLSRTTVLASTASTTAIAAVIGGATTSTVGAACSAAGTAATGALGACAAAFAVDDVWRGRGYSGKNKEGLINEHIHQAFNAI